MFVCLPGGQAFMQMFGPNALTKNTLTAFTLGECLLVAIEISRDTRNVPQLLPHLQLLLWCPKGRKMPASYSRAQLSFSLSLSLCFCCCCRKMFHCFGYFSFSFRFWFWFWFWLCLALLTGDGLAGDCFCRTSLTGIIWSVA